MCSLGKKDSASIMKKIRDNDIECSLKVKETIFQITFFKSLIKPVSFPDVMGVGNNTANYICTCTYACVKRQIGQHDLVWKKLYATTLIANCYKSCTQLEEQD